LESGIYQRIPREETTLKSFTTNPGGTTSVQSSQSLLRVPNPGLRTSISSGKFYCDFNFQCSLFHIFFPLLRKL
jgi:hypothetical protein